MPGKTIHGMHRHPVYTAWAHMIDRCTNPNNKMWAHYGGRGITVCERWRADFTAFRDDMGPRPDGLTLERKDNNKGYEPGNCVWATRHDQQFNRRVQSNNGTGLSGVSWETSRARYQVQIGRRGERKTLGYSRDFFEACCIRKSAEARLA